MGADLADMQLISKFNKGFRFLLCVIDNYSKYLMLLMILMDKKLLELFTQRNCKKTNKKECRIEKVIKRKGDKLYVKFKG